MSHDLLQYFDDEKITVSLIPGAAGSYVDGEWVLVLGASAPLVIIAPQPMTAKDIQSLPDGEHVRDYLKSWSETRVEPRDGGDDADRISYQGDTYKVMQSDDRATLGGFYAFQMRRLEPGTT
jgi:hypothetical protein